MCSHTSAEWVAAATVAAVLRSGDGAEAVRGAYEALVTSAFANAGEAAPVSRSQVRILISETFHLQFPELFVNEAIERLLGKRHLLRASPEDPDALLLAPDVLGEVRKERSSLSALKQRALSGWLRHEIELRPDLGQFEADLIDLLEHFIARFGAYATAEAVANWDPNSSQPPPPPPLPDKSFLSSKPEAVREAGVDACIRFFSEADEVRRDYILAVYDGYYELQLLRCTPEIQGVFTTQLADTVCYLDTNFVIDLLGLREPTSAISSQAVRLARDLGVRVRIAEETRQEYLGLLDAAERQLRAGASTNRESEASPFLEAYLREYARNRDLTWHQFRFRHESLQPLQDEYDIGYEPDARISDRSSIEPLAILFDRSAPQKNPSARAHDAAMYLLVRRERESRRDGVGAWFLSLDSHLLAFDRDAKRQSPDPGFALPSFVILPFPWVEWLRSRAGGRSVAGADPSELVKALCDLWFTRPSRDARVIVRLIQIMQQLRELPADAIQAEDALAMIDREIEARGGSSVLRGDAVKGIVDKAVATKAKEYADTYTEVSLRLGSLEELVTRLQTALDTSQTQLAEERAARERERIEREAPADSEPAPPAAIRQMGSAQDRLVRLETQFRVVLVMLAAGLMGILLQALHLRYSVLVLILPLAYWSVAWSLRRMWSVARSFAPREIWLMAIPWLVAFVVSGPLYLYETKIPKHLLPWVQWARSAMPLLAAGVNFVLFQSWRLRSESSASSGGDQSQP